MRKIFLVSLAILCFFMFGFTIANGISGKWAGHVTLPNGSEVDLIYVFTIDSGKLSGTVQAHGGPQEISNAKINGNDFSFDVPGDGASILPHTGRYYADGDSISMKINFGNTLLQTTLKRAHK